MSYDPARRPRPPGTRARQVIWLLSTWWARLAGTHRLLRVADPTYRHLLGALRAAIRRRDLRQIVVAAMRLLIDLIIAARD